MSTTEDVSPFPLGVGNMDERIQEDWRRQALPSICQALGSLSLPDQPQRWTLMI